MARARMLSRSLGCSRRFTNLTDEFAQLLFVMIIPHVDDYGRMTADPLSIKLSVLPASARSIEQFAAALESLHTVHLIELYEAESEIFLQISKFEEHQSGLHKRTESKLPAPSRNFPEFPGISGSRARAELKGTEGKGTEGKGKEKRTVPAARPSLRLPVENIKIITKLAHEVLKAHVGNGASSATLCEEIKVLCATRQIAYDSAVVYKALDSAEVQRKVKHR